MNVLQKLKNGALRATNYVQSCGRRTLVKASSYAVAAAVAVSCATTYAEGTTTTDPSWPTPNSSIFDGFQQAIASWVTIGIGIACTIFVIRVGWKYLRSFISRG